MIESNFELLGGSQTLVGVLLTVFLLCIFHDKNNFIDGILETIRRKISKDITDLTSQNAIRGVSESTEYKLLTYFLNGEMTENNRLLHERGAQLLVSITSRRSVLQFSYANLQPNINERFEKISISHELICAPLFCFVFCLILFVFDELLRFTSPFCTDIFISVISLLIAYSFGFWFVLWLHFYLKHIKKKSFKNPTRKTVIQNIKTFISFMLLYSLVCSFISFTTLQLFPFYYWISCVLLALFPIVYWAIMKFKFVNETKSYLFLLGHFIAILFVSAINCIIIFSCYTYFNCFTLVPFNFLWFKLSILIFTLTNGLVLPFLMPFWAYKVLENEMKTELKKSYKQAQEVEREIQEDLQKFASEIPVRS